MITGSLLPLGRLQGILECMMTIGSDQVDVVGERLMIHAAEPMDWPIREFCRVPIYFEGRKYYVRSKRKGERPCKAVYELWPWPAELHESARQHVIYDEAYVNERDALAARRRGYELVHLLLLPAYPLLGLCWSRFKNRVLAEVGFEPRSITTASVALTFSLFMAEGVFVGWLAGGALLYLIGRPGLRAADWALLLVLGADSLVRFNQSLRSDVDYYWGFCEWLWPKRHAPYGR